jgi:hypothetical protein
LKKLIFILSLFVYFSAFAQEEKPLVQFSGVIYDVDSNTVVPYVSITNVSNKNSAFAANYKGYFSFVVQEGDSIVFSSIGYKKFEIVVPTNLKDRKFTAIIKMKTDNISLPMVRVFPWASVEEFKKEFLSMKFADDDYEIAMKNLSKKSLRELSATLPRDGIENNAMSFGNLHRSLGNKNMVQTNPLLNPFAWAAFIKELTGKKDKDK